MTSIFIFLFLVQFYKPIAAVIDSYFVNLPANYVAFLARDESRPIRTVWDIFWRCLATTIALPWVCVHPNVPWLEEKSRSILKRKIYLMLVAVFVPQTMIMWAFKQWRGAVAIRDAMNEARPKTSMQWTMVHAHFLQMGGYKLNYMKGEFEHSHSHLYGYEVEKGGVVVQECVLTFEIIQLLLVSKLIVSPVTTAKEIKDKSEKTTISKALTVFQIIFFIIEIIARILQHLTITHIELTTAALVGLNGIICLFWWSKPLNVQCPIIIMTKGAEKAMWDAKVTATEGVPWEFNAFSSHRDDFWKRDNLPNSIQSTFSTLKSNFLRSLADGVNMSFRLMERPKRQYDQWSSRVVPTRQNLPVELDILSCGRVCLSWFLKFLWACARVCLFCLLLIYMLLQACGAVCISLVYFPYMFVAVPMVHVIEPRHSAGIQVSELRQQLLSTHNCKPGPFTSLKDKIHNKSAFKMLFNGDDMWCIMSMLFYSERAKTQLLIIFSAFAGITYGLIHCIEWNSDYPSPIERILWRTASLSIIGVGLGIAGGVPVYELSKKQYYSFRGIVILFLQLILLIAFTLSRLSILILPIMFLRNLPDSAFETTTWTKLILHV